MPLVEQIEQANYCRPPALQAAAIIRLRLAEELWTGPSGMRLMVS